MGLKQKIKEAKTLLQEKLDKASKNRLAVNVCMLGARGVGKTSVLCAILDDARSMGGFVRTKVQFLAKNDTRDRLYDLRSKLGKAFDDKTDIAAIPPSKGIAEYDFEVGLVGMPPNIDVTVTDYPGEQLQMDPDLVSERIKNSYAIIVAIDAPYVMEEEGIYNEEKNQTKLVSKFILDNIESFKNKLVIFVPLKCEKYLDLKTPIEKRVDRSEELARKVVEECYKGAITSLKETNNTAVAITPILTVGGVAFDHFENGEFGNKVAKYRFYDGVTQNGDRAKYQPQFCSQPIFYLLSFMTQCFERHRNSARGLTALLQSLSDFYKHNEEFFLEMKEIDRHRLKDTLGFKVICGEHLFYSKNS